VLHYVNPYVSLHSQSHETMTKKTNYIFRVTIEDWTNKQKIHYEANLIAVIDFIDKHATKTLTISEISNAIYHGETLRITNDHTCTIKKIGHDTTKTK